MPEKPSMLMPALYGGIIMGVISTVPVLSLMNCLCCAGVMFGGFMAVFFYKKEMLPGMAPLTSSDGLQLGALAGVFGGVIGSLLTVIVLKVIGNVNGQMILSMMEVMRDRMPAEKWDEMQGDVLATELSVFKMIMGLIIDVIFGLLGGLIGYSILKPKKELMNVQPPAPQL
ncbi:MAG: DUF4199 domain-containing protein [bacterium]